MQTSNPSNYMAVPYLGAWRAEKGMTQLDLATRAGIGIATVRRIEHGSLANSRTVADLARALGISVQDLLHVDPTARPAP